MCNLFDSGNSMYKLYHYSICPFSRKVRVVLSFKKVKFIALEEKFWERRKEFIMLNPAGEVPVLQDEDSGLTVIDSSIICDFLEEMYSEEESLISPELVEILEIKRLSTWFDQKFYREVTFYLLSEKFFNRFRPNGTSPSMKKIRAALKNLDLHLNYITFLLNKRTWLAGENFSLADVAAAAQLSSIDYFGDINWRNYRKVAEWYSLIKSKKCFESILQDRVAGFTPPAWYADLDF